MFRKCVLYSLQIFCFSAGYFNSLIPYGLWVILEDLGNNLSTNHNCCHVQSEALFLTAGFLMPQICQLRLYCYRIWGWTVSNWLLERKKDPKKIDLQCPHCWRSFLCVYQLVPVGYNGPVESGGVVEWLQAALHSALLFCPVLCFSRLICSFCTRNWPSFCLNVSILVLIPQLCCSTGFITPLRDTSFERE